MFNSLEKNWSLIYKRSGIGSTRATLIGLWSYCTYNKEKNYQSEFHDSTELIKYFNLNYFTLSGKGTNKKRILHHFATILFIWLLWGFPNESRKGNISFIKWFQIKEVWDYIFSLQVLNYENYCVILIHFFFSKRENILCNSNEIF